MPGSLWAILTLSQGLGSLNSFSDDSESHSFYDVGWAARAMVPWTKRHPARNSEFLIVLKEQFLGVSCVS